MLNLKIKEISRASRNPNEQITIIDAILEDGSICSLEMDFSTAKSLTSILAPADLMVDQAAQPSEKKPVTAQSIRLGSVEQGSSCWLELDSGLPSEANYLLDPQLFWNLAQYVTGLLPKMSKEPPKKLN